MADFLSSSGYSCSTLAATLSVGHPSLEQQCIDLEGRADVRQAAATRVAILTFSNAAATILQSNAGALATASTGWAELQDVCEAVLADRAQGRTRSHFALPLRREPEDTTLRTQLVQWTDRLCGVMANIFEEGMLLSGSRPTTGRRATGRGLTQSPARSRSPRMTPATHAKEIKPRTLKP